MPALDAEYGEFGSSGSFSSHDPVSIDPYTSSVDTCTNLASLVSSAACSSVWVPSTLVSTKSAPPRIDRSTCDSAAKCTTASACPTRSRTTSGSQMSPCTNSYRSESSTGSRLARLPA